MEIHDDEIMTDLFNRFFIGHNFSTRELQIWHELALQKPTLPLCVYGYDELSPAKKKRSRLRRSSTVPSKKQKVDEEKAVVCGASGCILPQG
jgi:hypothetical protein